MKRSMVPGFGPHVAFAKPEFDPRAFEQTECGRNSELLHEIYYRYPNDPMHPEVLRYWEEWGAKKELFDSDIDSGIGEYSVFTPLDMTSDKKYALIYCSHGGSDKINMAETYGFAHLVGTEKLICVCPWNGDSNNSNVEKDFKRIVHTLLEKGYPIDTERLYAVGFSSGSGATGRLTLDCPEMLAAVAPCPGPNTFNHGMNIMEVPAKLLENEKMRVPIICVGGTMDAGDQYPLRDENACRNFNIWMENISKVHNYQQITHEHCLKLCRDGSTKIKRVFGLDFHAEYICYLEGTYWYGGDYNDEEGNCVARLVSVEGMPHGQSKFFAPVIWEFLRHYSKDAKTGASVYTSFPKGSSELGARRK